MCFFERASYDPSSNHYQKRQEEAKRIFDALNSGDGIIEQAYAIADDNTHGYSMAKRCLNPDVDCSSFVFYSCKNAGIDLGQETPFSTHDMGGVLKGAGFQEIGFTSYADCQAGDILVRDDHTEIYLGNNRSIGAHMDYDGQDGDSSGREVCEGGVDGTYSLVYRK